MTGLLPEVVRAAVEERSLYAASESFGIVPLVLLVVLLLEQEALRVARPAKGTMTVLSAMVIPLLLAVMFTLALRVAQLL
ncbi:MAG: hypothetical protein M3296_10655 [Actinomycetota bacterium]|nr:hypothetical protein [Actinomycetota bacterium]